MTLLTVLAPTVAQQQIPTLWQGSDVRMAVEVAFRSNPLADVLLWEDITDYVREVSITRGRSGELDRFQPSTAAITVASTGRDFDPEYVSGPWYGYVLPNRAVRVRVQYDAGSGLVEYFVWQGFVDEWPQDYSGISAAQVTIPCSDAFAFLSTREAPDPFTAELQADREAGVEPLSWYRLGDAAGSTTAADSMGTKDGSYLGVPTLAQAALIAGSTDGSVIFPDGDPTPDAGGMIRVSPAQITGFPFAVEFVWQDTGVGGSPTFFRLNDNYADNTNPHPLVQARKTTSTTLSFFAQSSTATTVMNQTYSVPTYADGNPHHFVFICDANGIPSFYFDGVLQTVLTDFGNIAGQWSFDAAMDDLALGGSYDENNLWYQGCGAFDEFVIWDSVPTAARIAARAAAVFGWPGDTTTERADRVLDAASWPSWFRDIGTGATVCSTENITGSPYDQLMTLNDTEGGHCYVDGQGRIVFRGRTEMGSDTRSAVSQAVFGDA